MKYKSLFLVVLLFVSVLLCAEKAGSVKFVMGNVKYKPNNNSAFVKLRLNDALQMDGTLKIEMDSEIEILWTDNTTSNFKDNQTVQIRSMYEKTHKRSSWINTLKDRVNQLSLDNKQEAISVAGVRRDEAEVKTESELYWDAGSPVSLDKAVELFELQKYTDAIPLFLKVIEQGPLQRNAETARGYLILGYDKINDLKNRDLQIQKLQEDFPNSTLMDNLDIKK
jgi:hypothetical protein